MSDVKSISCIVKELCIFAKYVWKQTISEYPNAYWWICFSLLCI